MSALAASRKNFSNKGPVLLDFGFPAKASKVFYPGALVMKGTDGYLIPAATTAGGRVMGVVELENHPSVDTTGTSDGDVTLCVRMGIFPFAIGASTDAVTKADEGNDVYVLDDQTISRLAGSGRPVAGQLFLVEGTTAWVSIGYYTPKRSGNAAGTAYQGDGSVEAVSAAGALSVNTHITTLAVTGTTAYTLANGLFLGQRKIVTVLSGASTPVGTVTPATTVGVTTVTGLGVPGESCEFIWGGAGAWYLVGVTDGVTHT